MSDTGRVNSWRRAIPTGITVLRLPCAIWFFFAYRPLQTWTLGLLMVAIVTDLLDGYLARRMKVASSCGAYWDVTADFLFVLAAFAAFVRHGFYPFWILLLMGAMFVQFLLTSRQGRPVYDPVGKYYGTFLFISIGITLVFPSGIVFRVILVSLLGLTLVSLGSRIVAFRAGAASPQEETLWKS
jgi:phosphatidylglycerophosphate synthase